MIGTAHAGWKGTVHEIARHMVEAWGLVGIPLAWGVIETVLNAMKLFQ